MICFRHTLSKKAVVIVCSYDKLILIVLCRGMALCFIMMAGRIGAIVGSNYTGALIEGNCEVIFILNAAFLTGKNFFLLNI